MTHMDSLVQVPWLIGGGDMTDYAAEILFQSFLQEAIVSSSRKDKVACKKL